MRAIFLKIKNDVRKMMTLCVLSCQEQYTLSFVPTDVRGDTTYLKQGDKVNFRISTDER